MKPAGDSFVSSGRKVLEVSLRWLEQTNADLSHLLLVKKWRDEAARIRCDSMKQSSLFSYFKCQNQSYNSEFQYYF